MQRAVAATTDQQYRPAQITFDQTFHVFGKVRINVPIGCFLPGDMLGPHWMTDIHVLDFRSTIDEHGIRSLPKKGVRGRRVKVLHGRVRK